jgi:integrase
LVLRRGGKSGSFTRCETKICREKWIEYARRLLGHTNMSTTQRYMHLDDSELADAQDLID